jgi:hypothetical protein
MNFAFNENACRIIADLYRKKLERLEIELQYWRSLQPATTEPMAVFSLDQIISKLEYERSYAELEVKKMEHYLNASSQP